MIIRQGQTIHQGGHSLRALHAEREMRGESLPVGGKGKKAGKALKLRGQKQEDVFKTTEERKKKSMDELGCVV